MELLPFQKDGVLWVRQHFHACLADDMGLGKSVQTASVIHQEKPKRALIICPGFLRVNWEREIKAWSPDSTVHIVKPGNENFSKKASVTIIGYDSLRRCILDLRAHEWDLLVADEAQYLKEVDTARTMAVFGSHERRVGSIPAARKLLLSGTPFLNRPRELWPLLWFLAPKEFANRRDFLFNFCGAHEIYVPGKGKVWNFDGASNLDELRRLIAPYFLRRTKAQVMPELPSKRRQILEVPVKISGEERDVVAGLRALKDHTELGHAEKTAFEQMAAVRKATALAKLPDCVEHIRNVFESGVEKLVVFGHHREILVYLSQHLACYGPVMIHGGVDAGVRQNLADAFQNDHQHRLLLGNIKAAGVGLNLTVASHEVFVELDWSPMVMSQAEDRCNRYGSVHPLLVQQIVAEGSIDAYMARRLVAKQEDFDKVFEGL